MKEKIKKELKSYGIMAIVALILYMTGWHTYVISFLQRGILATGLMQPRTEQPTADLPVPNLNIELEDANGQVLNMQQFQGKVLFINLWATWCPPCLAEMPNIDQLYTDLEPEKDIVFLMLSTDQDFSKAVQHVADKGFNFPVYQIRRNWPPELNSSTLPTTFVIDKQGRLVLAHRGMAKYNTSDFKAYLRGL
ncbi:MAG: TlpA disulfide reductase family protein [Saprospiraceae bacterium]|nr:TlpA family protein disulfide reductase [Lewinella sp.]